MSIKKIAILGSTGSIGTNSLDVIRHLGDGYEVVALAAQSNIDTLEKQAKIFHPQLIAVFDESKALELQKRLPSTRVLGGMEGLIAVAREPSVNFVIAAISGTHGLKPTLAAIEAGKNIGLANKEVLVSAGSLVMQRVNEKGVQLIPIDSEHSALFQCLQGNSKNDVSRLILTASGGPFRQFNEVDLKNISVDQALAHPNWKMGPKVSIDSSTLMNKGLEVIEAHWLFGISLSQIDVVIHPQSIIHSMVEYIDGSILAQMSEPSMILPIQFALTYPHRQLGMLKPFDFIRFGKLEFSSPDLERFRCLKLAYEAIQMGGSMPCYMNAANEVLVERFIKDSIRWHEISTKLETLMERHSVETVETLDHILSIDHRSRLDAALV